MRIFGLIGHPLGHSFSQQYFKTKFEHEQLSDDYINFDLPTIEEIEQLILHYPELKGFNVTIPYKQAILPYLDDLDEVAGKLQAVNTVKVLDDGRLKGFNTDVVGFEHLLEESGFKGGSALILGTGGASQAVQYVLKNKNINYQLVSRNRLKGSFTYETLQESIIKDHPLIVNTTPLGTFPDVDGFPEIPYHAISNQHTLIDLVYNPEETAFLQKGKQQGAKTFNGLTMLYAQAEASWNLWNTYY